jgi:hypothetical protein
MTVHYPMVEPERFGWRQVMKQIKTALLLRRSYDALKAFSIPGSRLSSWDGPYLPETDAWTEAWIITERYLVKLHEAVHANGGTLFIVPVPEYIQLSHEWQEDLQEFYHAPIPQGFVRERPRQKLDAIAKAHNLSIISLDAMLRAYRDHWTLPAPYFYYRCDGHWNPLGHFLAANMIADHLIERGLVRGNREAMKRNLTRSPKDILSVEGYQQIYFGGRFTGVKSAGR